ncbi:MAG: diguanylate cyclase [Candidatus Uhrbacteria bacterium]
MSHDVYQPQGRRLRESKANEAVLELHAEVALQKVKDLETRPDGDRELAQAKMDFEEANLDLEIFDLQNDPTGALKREAIGVDLGEQIVERLAAGKDPNPEITAEMITPVFLVNMGELDRLNKEGHDFGDVALTRLAGVLTRKIEQALEPILGEENISAFQIYRADSNSFMVRFTREIPKEVAQALQKHLSSRAGEAWESEGDLFSEKGSEAPPVVTDFVSMEEVLAGMPPSLRSSGKAETYAVGAVRDVLFSLQEAHKIVNRTERIRDVLTIENNEAKARDLYDKYLKKSIAGVYQMSTGAEENPSLVETFDSFVAYLNQLKNDPHPEAKLWEASFGKVLGDLRVRYAKDSKYAEQLQGFVAEKVERDQKIKVRETPSTKPPGKKLPEDKPVEEFVMPDKESATEGLRMVAGLKEEINKYPAGSQEMRIAEKRLTREKMMRDSATGLEQRGPMYKRLESALEDGTKRIATVSMDMGFLKYFDQVGGRETGDLAILKMAEVFQNVKDNFTKNGIEVNAYRLGGDEFGMTVIGEGSVSLEDFQKILADLKASLDVETRRVGRIPKQDGAKPGYFATELQLGIGIHSYENGQSAEQEDRQYELTNSVPEGIVPGLPSHKGWVLNKRAEHLVKVSDKVMEFQKSSNRMMLLVEKMKGIQDLKNNGASEDDIDREEELLKQLLGFSDKAIFAEEGRTMLKQLGEKLASGISSEDLDTQIHEFVWSQMDATFQKELAEKKDLGSSVEYAVRIEYLRDRVSTLEERLSKVDRANDTERERRAHDVKRLKERLGSAEKDLEVMKGLRASLGADKMAA